MPDKITTGIAIKNAGMVLLNSYISLYFERLGITNGNQFTGTDRQLSAVHYLQYIVTGQTHTAEAFLPLNKILCGIALPMQVPEGITVFDSDKQMTEGLIKAMISHWPAIGASSVEGFRGNWLIRNGLLHEHNDKWELVVEKRAYDIPLHRSPFLFSIIKYPWMPKPLHVSWP
jgi:hypothetical protein